jgi:hypothetical protein
VSGSDRALMEALNMNARWHRQHPMPKHPTEQARVKWHLAHTKVCGCRDMPDSVAALIRRFRASRVARPKDRTRSR